MKKTSLFEHTSGNIFKLNRNLETISEAYTISKGDEEVEVELEMGSGHGGGDGTSAPSGGSDFEINKVTEVGSGRDITKELTDEQWKDLVSQVQNRNR